MHGNAGVDFMPSFTIENDRTADSALTCGLRLKVKVVGKAIVIKGFFELEKPNIGQLVFFTARDETRKFRTRNDRYQKAAFQLPLHCLILPV